MKYLYLVRHAKSSWSDLSLDDFDRPLNKRGKHNAPFMGEKLRKRGVKPDIILSSPALRAKKTAQKIAKELGYPVQKIKWRKGIYEATESHLLAILQSVKKELKTVMMVGHNPEFTQFSNMLCDSYIYNIPTSGVVCIQFDVEKWSEVSEKSGELLFFDYPKRYLTSSL